MRILAFDTSSPNSAVAVVEDERVLAEDDEPSTGRHGDVLLPRIERQLARAGLALRDLDLIGVGLGPGSFTGIRVGLATAKGLALATPLAVCGVSSLRVLARAISAPCELLVPVLDAGKGEVFAAVFRREHDALEQVLEPLCARPEQLAERLAAFAGAELGLCGAGANAHRALFEALGPRVQLFSALPHGRHVAAEARREVAQSGPADVEALVPLYLRGSDAKLPARPLSLA